MRRKKTLIFCLVIEYFLNVLFCLILSNIGDRLILLNYKYINSKRIREINTLLGLWRYLFSCEFSESIDLNKNIKYRTNRSSLHQCTYIIKYMYLTYMNATMRITKKEQLTISGSEERMLIKLVSSRQ